MVVERKYSSTYLCTLFGLFNVILEKTLFFDRFLRCRLSACFVFLAKLSLAETCLLIAVS